MPRGNNNNNSKNNRRNAYGAGSIRKKTVTRGGKQYTYWEARYTTGSDPGTGKQRQKSVTGRTQEEVAQKLRQITTEIDAGIYQEPGKITVGEWLDIWSAEYLGNIKPWTAEKYKSVIRTHIKPALGAIRLDALSAPAVQHFYNESGKDRDGKKGLAPKTVKNLHGVLHKALQQAVDVGYIRVNPTSSCKLPRVEKPEIEPLDSEQIALFMQAIKGHRYETLYLVTLFTGMRRGEVCGLQWDCVDFTHGTICVKRQLQKVPGERDKVELTSTKNGKGRTIVPAASVMALLKRHRAEQRAMRLRAGEAWQENNFVFCNELGQPLSAHTVYQNYKRIVASIGLPGSRVHDLRHSYAVASIMSGDDIKTVQENLGHATAAFTLDRYGHVTEQMKKASSERMEQFIRTVSGS